MTVYIPPISNSTPVIIGQIFILESDVGESFNFTFDKGNYQALLPAIDQYTIISDDGSDVYVRITFSFDIY